MTESIHCTQCSHGPPCRCRHACVKRAWRFLHDFYSGQGYVEVLLCVWAEVHTGAELCSANRAYSLSKTSRLSLLGSWTSSCTMGTTSMPPKTARVGWRKPCKVTMT